MPVQPVVTLSSLHETLIGLTCACVEGGVASATHSCEPDLEGQGGGAPGGGAGGGGGLAITPPEQGAADGSSKRSVIWKPSSPVGSGVGGHIPMLVGPNRRLQTAARNEKGCVRGEGHQNRTFKKRS